MQISIEEKLAKRFTIYSYSNEIFDIFECSHISEDTKK